MAAPNLLSLTTITGKTTPTTLATTSATSILNNAASSGTVLKVTSVLVVNIDGTNSADVTVSYYNEDDLGGTESELIQSKAVAPNTNLVVVSKDNPIYLEEDRSLGATASAGGDLVVFVTYELIA